MPKFIEVVFKKIVNERIVNSKPIKVVLIALLCGILGLAHSRNHFSKEKEEDKEDKQSV